MPVAIPMDQLPWFDPQVDTNIVVDVKKLLDTASTVISSNAKLQKKYEIGSGGSAFGSNCRRLGAHKQPRGYIRNQCAS